MVNNIKLEKNAEQEEQEENTKMQKREQLQLALKNPNIPQESLLTSQLKNWTNVTIDENYKNLGLGLPFKIFLVHFINS